MENLFINSSIAHGGGNAIFFYFTGSTLNGAKNKNFRRFKLRLSLGGYTAVFKRYEMKYMLTREQKEEILRAMEGRMALDRYGRTTIRNLYYDTDTYLMIRRSLEKPSYKEKLRIRSYARAGADSTVFVELKKKYKSVVYKRRVALPCREAMAWAGQERHCQTRSQICDEIDYTWNRRRPARPSCPPGRC